MQLLGIVALAATGFAVLSNSVWPVETALPSSDHRIEIGTGDEARWRTESDHWVIEELRWGKAPASPAQLSCLLPALGTFAQEKPFPGEIHTSTYANARSARIERNIDIGDSRLTYRLTVFQSHAEALDAGKPDALHQLRWRGGTPSGKGRQVGQDSRTQKGSAEGFADLAFVQGRLYANLAIYSRTALPADLDRLEALAKAIEFRASRIPDIGFDGIAAADKKRLSSEYVSLTELKSRGATVRPFIKADSKYATVTIKNRDYTFGMLSWHVRTPTGEKELSAPAIPYDGDLYVPASFVNPLLGTR